jgi:hypothetical protein
LPLESEAKKRLRLLEMKDYEGGRKCLSPSIFRKNKGPLILGGHGAASQSGPPTSASSDTTSKGFQTGAKKSDLTNGLKDFNMGDMDIN